MDHFRAAEHFRSWSRQIKARGETVALVPTMGALHEGHLSLLQLASERADHVAASIFVNPTQFGPNEDLDSYPRDLVGDADKLRARGCEVVFAPSASEIYSEGFSTYVVPESLSEALCGASRPGHFRGVATIVAILARISLADVLVLGEKDYQQLQIVRRMIRDLWLDVEVVPGPTIREPDGLAMSSRNAYLSSEQRIWAAAIPRALDRAASRFSTGERRAQKLIDTATGALREVPLQIEYVHVVDAESLKPQSVVRNDAILAVAASAGTTRLIDNCRLSVA